MFWLGLPVHDREDLTEQCLDSIRRTVLDPEQMTLVVIDNDSTKPILETMGWAQLSQQPFKVVVERFSPQLGYYQAIPYLASKATPADIVGVIHNDVVLYEDGWDRRLREAFLIDPQLASVGFCGSYELDQYGGRGGGTMCWFRGERGQSQRRRSFEHVTSGESNRGHVILP